MPTPSAELSEVPLHGFRGEVAAPTSSRPQGLTVAISREAGARGNTIGKKVARILDWQLFDHDTLDYLTQNETARAQLFTDLSPEAVHWAETQLTRLQQQQGLKAEGETLHLVKLILMIAARGNVVIVGRAAGFMLPRETTIHVRVVAPLESRVTYMAQEYRLTHAEAVAEVRSRDDSRAAFLDRILARHPADLTCYDAIVNSDRLGVEAAAQFIGWAVRTKQMFTELAGPRNGPALGTLDEFTGA